MRLLIILAVLLLAWPGGSALAQDETPTATPVLEPIPTVTLEFGGMVDQGESMIGIVVSSGDDSSPLQYIVLAFGGMVIGFGLLSFVVLLAQGRLWRE